MIQKKYLRTTTKDRRCTTAHVLIAEQVLGHRLPVGAEVHHVDGNGLNNAKNNLVICPSSAYHKLLHMRQRALAATGNPDLRKCRYCKQWDSNDNLRIAQNLFEHRQCQLEHQRSSYIRNKAKRQAYERIKSARISG